MSDYTPNEEHVYVRYKRGEDEMEAKGPIKFVNEHAYVFLRSHSNQPEQLVLPIKSDENLLENKPNPVLATENGSEQETTTNAVSNHAQNFLLFYRGKNPQSQGEQIAVITFYLQKYRGVEMVNSQGYKDALVELRKANIKPINNVSLAAITAEKRGWLYRPNPDEVAFALTFDGEEFVENMQKEV